MAHLDNEHQYEDKDEGGVEVGDIEGGAEAPCWAASLMLSSTPLMLKETVNIKGAAVNIKEAAPIRV